MQLGLGVTAVGLDPYFVKLVVLFWSAMQARRALAACTATGPQWQTLLPEQGKLTMTIKTGSSCFLQAAAHDTIGSLQAQLRQARLQCIERPSKQVQEQLVALQEELHVVKEVSACQQAMPVMMMSDLMVLACCMRVGAVYPVFAHVNLMGS